MALNFMLDDLNTQMRKAQEEQLAKEQAQEEQKQAQIRARQAQNENVFLNANNNNKTKSDELIQEEIDFIQKADNSAKKMDFNAHAIEQVRKNPNIKEALENLDKQDLLNDEKEKLNQQHKQDLENLEKKYNINKDNAKEKEQSNSNDGAIQNTLDEKYLQELEALNSIHKACLEKIENERLEHEMKFQKAIDNICNANSTADILANLKN